ncbi:hypothetical protein TNCV_4545321 [Trichonephila clavipes]|nr:hypothetical protein TNCV_4545321 [Trichonephila clavipes]
MKCVREWFARFRECWESVSDKSHREKPGNSISDENIEKVNITQERSYRHSAVSMIRVPQAAGVPKCTRINRKMVRALQRILIRGPLRISYVSDVIVRG